MNITLYNMTSEANCIGKTKTAVYPTMSGYLRNESSRNNPVITIEASAGGLSTCNYMYIEEFNRYYFVTDIVSVRTGVVDIYGKVDVLESFKTDILNSKVILKRQRDNWNLYLDDGSFLTYCNDYMYTINFSNGIGNDTFVLVTAGH